MIDRIRSAGANWWEAFSEWWETLTGDPLEVGRESLTERVVTVKGWLVRTVEEILESLRTPILGVPAWTFGVGILMLLGMLAFPVPVAENPPTGADEIGELPASDDSASSTARTRESYFYGSGLRVDTTGGLEVFWDDGWKTPTNMSMVQSYDAERGVYYERSSFVSSSGERKVTEKWVTSRGTYFRETTSSKRWTAAFVDDADTYRWQGYDVVSFRESEGRAVIVWGETFEDSESSRAQEFWNRHGSLSGVGHERVLVSNGSLVGSDVVGGSVDVSDSDDVAYAASFKRVSLPYVTAFRDVYGSASLPVFAKVFTPKKTYSGSYERTSGASGVPSEQLSWVVEAQDEAASSEKWVVVETGEFPVKISNQSISAGPSAESAVIQGTVTNTDSNARHIRLNMELYRATAPGYGSPDTVSMMDTTFVESGESVRFTKEIPLEQVPKWSEVQGYSIDVSESSPVLDATTVSGKTDTWSEDVVVQEHSFAVREGADGSVEHVVQGTFENQDETSQSVELTITAYDENGFLLGTEYAEYRNVDPGETLEFEELLNVRWTNKPVDEYKIAVRSTPVNND